MNEREIKVFQRIPKRVRTHIVCLTITESNDYNEQGQRLNDYAITWDNGDLHVFQNIRYMIDMLKEYTNPDDGYYYEP